MDCAIPGTPGAQFECQHPQAPGLGGAPSRVKSAARARPWATVCQRRQAAVAATL